MIIGTDKFQHFSVCAEIAAATAYTIKNCGAPSIASCASGFIAGMSAGLGKEYGDKNAPGNKWDWIDIVADTIGSAVGCVAGFIPNIL